MRNVADVNLRSLLHDWEDPDVTQYYLACCLGLIPYDDDFSHFRALKHVFWTTNSTSVVLIKLLEIMLQDGLLEFDEGESKYRWNNSCVVDLVQV